VFDGVRLWLSSTLRIVDVPGQSVVQVVVGVGQ
jgi:hypothetical protein